MQMYPAYKLRDVLEEYAICFFTLLNEGYRLKSAEYMMAGKIADLPHMKREDRVRVYKDLEFAATHPGDILKTGEGSSPAEIKKMLGG